MRYADEYLQQVGEVCDLIDPTLPSPPLEVWRFALDQKQPEALRRVDPNFNGLNPNDQVRFSREKGGVMARFVVASWTTSLVSEQPYIGGLSMDDQQEAFHKVTDGMESQPFAIDMHEQLARAKRVERRKILHRLARLGCYANVLPDSFPPDFWNDNPGQLPHDVTLTQAFGRNGIPDKELGKTMSALPGVQDDIKKFELLASMEFDAGQSNQALAETIKEQLSNPDVIIEQIMQWEVAQALWEMNPDFYAAHQEALHVLWPAAGVRAYRTYEVKADSVQIMEKLGLYNPYEFAHPDMMIRALGILAKLGVEADTLRATIPFDPASVQPQARGAKEWVSREFLTRVHHSLTGKVRF